MPKNKSIPIIDLFAGPGGLGEGFSSVQINGKRAFDIKLSIEKDSKAHSTLELRSFFRKFRRNTVPNEYYDVLRATNLQEREKLKEHLYRTYSKEYQEVQEEAWCAELGGKLFPQKLVDKRIKTALQGEKDWVLIGGPPCQAYSIVGRSRVGGIDEKDDRVYLYKQYLRIIATHQPSVFVMENVKGLLSAKLKSKNIFNRMIGDLAAPSKVYKKHNSPRYKIYSLSSDSIGDDIFDNPIYEHARDFIIKSECYGVPQKRHRVILIGVREDIKTKPKTLVKKSSEVNLEEVISDLPKIRSGLSRKVIGKSFVNGKNKQTYKKIEDTNEIWKETVNRMKTEILSLNGFSSISNNRTLSSPKKGTGSEFIKYKTPKSNNPLYNWYKDERINGVVNHESRSHLLGDIKRYMFASLYAKRYKRFPRLQDYAKHQKELIPNHRNFDSGKFTDRFRVQLPNKPATTITSHISKDGHYFIHYDYSQCRSLSVREAARVQTFPDNYLFCGSRTAQFHQVGNAVPPYLAYQIAKIVKDLI